MPWPSDHKARTRERIVRAAAAAFRSRGTDGVRVEDVMKAAGLTHGGFYAHFGSKDELVGAALEQANAETLALLGDASENLSSERRLHAVVDAYLSPAHAAHPERGCPIAALGPEIARAGVKNRRRLAKELASRIEWVKAIAPGERDADSTVVPLLACMVGGLILSRVAGGKRREQILESCRRFLHSAISSRDARAAPVPS